MKKYLLFIAIIFCGVLAFNASLAQEKQLDYKGEVIVDSDLDGLTDLGEKEIFKTDPQNPDSDGDGFFDGTEVVSKTDPLDNSSPRTKETIEKVYTSTQGETPWAWYLTRASALLGFLLLYISFLLGLSIRIPVLNKIIKPIYSFEIHCWISLQALLFALFHGLILLWDKFMGFGIKNVLIPFYPVAENQMAGINSKTLALGILSFYIMLILVLTSYLKKYISQAVWRGLHFLNIGLFIAIFIHALYLGTDLKSGPLRTAFIIANLLILLLLVINLSLQFIKPIFKGKSSDTDEKREE